MPGSSIDTSINSYISYKSGELNQISLSFLSLILLSILSSLSRPVKYIPKSTSSSSFNATVAAGAATIGGITVDICPNADSNAKFGPAIYLRILLYIYILLRFFEPGGLPHFFIPLELSLRDGRGGREALVLDSLIIK